MPIVVIFQDMPFECNYCKDPFCAEHRLPEEHRCVKLTQIRAKKFGQKKVIRDGGRNKPSFFKRIFRKILKIRFLVN